MEKPTLVIGSLLNDALDLVRWRSGFWVSWSSVLSQLAYTIFQDVFFPPVNANLGLAPSTLSLETVRRYQVAGAQNLAEIPLVIFDFETTGLDSEIDHIIEVGAIKTRGGIIEAEFSTLIQPPIPITEAITKITGITPEMLEGQPTMEDILGDFLGFFDKAILVAHNAVFDAAFLNSACRRRNIMIDWPIFCTLKLARHFLPDLESRSLDTLAEHYGFRFEARHRSIGDCKVTSSVLQSLLASEASGLTTWADMQPFIVK